MQKGKISSQFLPPGGSWFPDMFCNFYLVKNHKIAKNSETTKAGEKQHRFGNRFLEFFYLYV
jgi:hypothetical protein